ncbi:unnamed protein product [Arctia plantaginis]|uniref:Carboxylesterase type B domain-containing protein n=1 Tax=Arctia plantaginis TaxID=874455 RepID=A0A8S1APW7_ARCPL|nr:unnamed protein product [Arctia plantaginis]
MKVVRVTEGLLEGEEIQNEYGGTYFSFKGIPYAQPPVGDLRFKAPQSVRTLDWLDQESESFQLISTVTKLWTNFAKYGNPTPDKSLGVEWKPYTLQNQEYLDLGNKLVMDTIPEKEELEFWDSIFKEYLPKYLV